MAYGTYARIKNTGIFFSANTIQFDEVTQSKFSVNPQNNSVYSNFFDEVAPSTGVGSSYTTPVVETATTSLSANYAGVASYFNTSSSVTYSVDQTYTKTTSLTSSFGTNYLNSYPAGTFMVAVITVRSSSAANSTTLTDSAGNSYTKAVEGTQSNGLTVSSIWYSNLTNSVTTGTTLTANLSAVSYTNAQHLTLFQLTNISSYESSNTSTSSSNVITNTLNVSSPGILIQCVSTGVSANTAPVSYTPGTSTSAAYVSLCSQYTSAYINGSLGSSTYPPMRVSNTGTTLVTGFFDEVEGIQ